MARDPAGANLPGSDESLVPVLEMMPKTGRDCHKLN
jgi:hypothetical protein